MIETKEREIEGFTYAVTQLGATAGRKLLTRLVQLAGPALGDLVRGVETKAGDVDITPDAIGAALATFAAKLSESEIEAIFKVLLPTSTVSIDGADVPLAGIAEIHFAGRYGAMLKWLGFALEVNFGGFFAGSNVTGIALRAFAAKSNPPSQSPNS